MTDVCLATFGLALDQGAKGIDHASEILITFLAIDIVDVMFL
jgi:hypothetical protein